jgi:hypothetical protein
MIGNTIETDDKITGTIIDKYRTYDDVFGDRSHIVWRDAYLLMTEEGIVHEVFPEDIKKVTEYNINNDDDDEQ